MPVSQSFLKPTFEPHPPLLQGKRATRPTPESGPSLSGAERCQEPRGLGLPGTGPSSQVSTGPRAPRGTPAPLSRRKRDPPCDPVPSGESWPLGVHYRVRPPRPKAQGPPSTRPGRRAGAGCRRRGRPTGSKEKVTPQTPGVAVRSLSPLTPHYPIISYSPAVWTHSPTASKQAHPPCCRRGRLPRRPPRRKRGRVFAGWNVGAWRGHPPSCRQATSLFSPLVSCPVRGSSPAYSSALPGRRRGDLHAKRRNAVRFMQSGGPAQAAGLSGGGEQMALGEVKGIILSAGVSASHLDIPSTITRHFSRQNKGVFARRD